MILFLICLASGNDWKTAFILSIVLSLATAVILLPLGYWSYEILRPKTLNKRLDDPAFNQFISAGFEKKDSWLQGKYKGYYGIVLWTDNNPLDTSNKLTYSVQIIFYFEGPKYFEKNLYDNYVIDEQIIWGVDYAAGIINSGKKDLPDSEQIMRKADRLIQLMLIFDLKPISEEIFKLKNVE